VGENGWWGDTPRLSTETVEGTALALQGVDNVERSDSLALGVFSVGDRVADDVLELVVSE
jgi:hypothetical protein